jgi:cell wall-associated NlpC family hydrolase
MTLPDPRINAWRTDLADRRLEGTVPAERFVEGWRARVRVASTGLRQAPRPNSEWGSELILGDDVAVFEDDEGWCWVQAARDGYVGYVADTALAPPVGDPTHIVGVPRTYTYPGPELRAPAVSALSMGSRVIVTGTVERRGTAYALLDSGEAIVARHLWPLGGAAVGDYVAVAETLLHTPYLWGGTSGFGLDCSGLVQLAMRMAGRDVPRDTDMQEKAVGARLDIDPLAGALARGDLVFWKGHVGIMVDNATMIHANGLSMTVALEPLAEAIARIEPVYGRPTSIRRP